ERDIPLRVSVHGNTENPENQCSVLPRFCVFRVPSPQESAFPRFRVSVSRALRGYWYTAESISSSVSVVFDAFAFWNTRSTICSVAWIPRFSSQYTTLDLPDMGPMSIS